MTTSSKSKVSGRLFTALFVLGMGATVSLAPEAAAQQLPTNQTCTSAWNSSSASNSCGQRHVHNVLAQIYVTLNPVQCSITVECSTLHWGTNRIATFTGSVSQMGQLKNCNGNLQVGSC